MPGNCALSRTMPPRHSLSSPKGLPSLPSSSSRRWNRVPFDLLMSLVSHRWVWSVAPLLLLTGCTPTEPAQSVQSPAPQATAPAVSTPPAQTAPAPDPPPQQPVRSAQQQRVQVLIEQVEKAYANGQTDYHKGDLPGAKAEFDRAVDLMLTSGIDIKSDQQLEDEFDRIVD